MKNRLLTTSEAAKVNDCTAKALTGCELLRCLEMGDLPSPCKADWNVSMPARGLGDVVAKITHATGLDKVAQAISTATGKPCGCGKRQEQLNEAVPFNKGM